MNWFVFGMTLWGVVNTLLLVSGVMAASEDPGPGLIVLAVGTVSTAAMVGVLV